jgi:hypothetical protein
MRSIPEELIEPGKSMVASGMRVAHVFRWMRRDVEKKGNQVAFNYQDVYTATCASTAERAMDATNLLEALHQREKEEGAMGYYCTQTDPEHCLKSVFFAMPGAHEAYAVDVDRQVVQLDTKVRLTWR